MITELRRLASRDQPDRPGLVPTRHPQATSEEGLTMKVKVDGSICQGHTLCAMAAPKVFQLDDEDGHAREVSEDVPTDLEPAAVEASRSCPEQAIRIF
jgi:ferredoxin